MTVRRTLLPAALAVLGAVALPTAAHADSRTFHDAPGDVLVGPSSEDNPTTPDPARTAEDIRTLRVSHGPRAVRVVVSYAALTPASTRGTDVIHVIEMRTNEGVRAGAYLIVPADGSRPGGNFGWDGERRAPTSCRSASARLDRVAGTVTFTVPRRCLSHPRWVRVGAGAGALTEDRLWADDAQANGRLGHDLVLGPRVRR